MSEHILTPRNYVINCVLLVLLTVLTVAVSFMPLAPVWHTAIGLIIAVCKASLVVLIFMHVIASPRLTWTVIVVAFFWLGLLFVLTMNDYVTRGMLPFVPGH